MGRGKDRSDLESAKGGGSWFDGREQKEEEEVQLSEQLVEIGLSGCCRYHWRKGNNGDRSFDDASSVKRGRVDQ